MIDTTHKTVFLNQINGNITRNGIINKNKKSS